MCRESVEAVGGKSGGIVMYETEQSVWQNKGSSVFPNST